MKPKSIVVTLISSYVSPRKCRSLEGESSSPSEGAKGFFYASTKLSSRNKGRHLAIACKQTTVLVYQANVCKCEESAKGEARKE